MTDLKDCYTAIEAAAELRLHPHTLADWRTKGKGPKFLKHSKFIYYKKAEIEKYKREYLKEYESTAQAKYEGDKK